MCNKQRYLKRDCLQNGQGGGTLSPPLFPITRVICILKENDSEHDLTEDQMNHDPKNELMTRLRGMTLDERDEIIDSLISQENF